MLLKKVIAIGLCWSFMSQSLGYIPSAFAQLPPEPAPYPVQTNNNSPLSTAKTGGSTPRNITFSEQILNQSGVNLFQGAATFSLPIQTPQGVNGFQPELSLSYNSQSFQNNGMLGFGWGMNLGSIKRMNINGVDEMYRHPTYYASVGPVQGELILLSNQNGIETYGLRREQAFAKILFNTNSNSWTVTTTNGITFKLGSSENSRLINADGTKTYAWHVEKTLETHGITIEYEYLRLDNNLYPRAIHYGAPANGSQHPFEIRFQPFYDHLTAPNRLDHHFDFHRGFRVGQKHLLTKIEVWVQDEQRLNYTLNYRSDSFRSDLKNLTIQTVGSTPELSQTIALNYYHRSDGYTGELFHRQYLLRSVAFPKGGKITWNYLPSNQFITNGNDFNERPHFPVTLVSSISRYSGQGSSATTSLHYQDAWYYFASEVERELAGYGRVIVTDPLNQKTIYYFHQSGGFDGSALGESEDNWALIGQMYRREAFNAQGKMIQRTIHHWETTALGSKRHFIAQTSTLSTLFNSGGQTKSTATSSFYDETNGNLLESIEHGEVTGNNNGTFADLGNDDRKTIISYASDTDLNLFAFPARQQLFDQNNVLIAEQQWFYDELPFGSVSKGDMTETSNTFFEENRSIRQSRSYNENGQLLSITDALGNVTTMSYDDGSLYPESITNALGHTQTYRYDLLYGQILEVEDANGLKSKTTLDGLGRITAQHISDPDENDQLITMQSIEYQETEFPHSIILKTHLSETETAETITYFDGFGRVIQTRGEDDGNASQYIVSNTKYDALGRTIEVTLPVFATGISFNLSQGSGIKTITSYDALDRPLSISDANGTSTFSYDLWTTTITDALGNSKTTETDAFGRLVKVVERVEGTEYLTRYTYDVRNLLAKITDANGNIRNFGHDSLGRMTKQEDLHAPGDTDFGVRTSTFDDNSNVLSVTKADGSVVNFSYDELNRPLTQIGPSISYEYEYDQGSFGIGRLTSVSSPEYSWSAEYDLRGRVTSETMTIDGESYEKNYSYTRFDQTDTITTPDGIIQNYTYNQIGQIKEINSSTGGIITHISYSPLSQVEALSYGNGLRSTFVYDPNQMDRLIEKRTAPASVPVTFKTLPVSITSLGFPLFAREGKRASARVSSLIPPFPHFPHFPLLPPPARAQEIPGILPFEDTQPTVIDDTEDPVRDLLEQQLRERGPNREGQRSERKLNQMRDTSGEILKPVITHNGPLRSGSNEWYFQVRYENTTNNPSPAIKYQITVEQAGTNGWDSGPVELEIPLAPGETSPYIPFNTQQVNGEASWKIAFILQDGTTTPWSDLAEIQTNHTPTAPETDELQNIKYTYDAIGNITRLEETSGTAASKTAEYIYDDLYRLTSSTVTGTIVGEDYIQTQSYDSTGNILSKSDQGNYSYAQAGMTNPQAVTSIDDGQGNTKTFTYDANGNLIQETQTSANGSTLQKSLNWDELDRITSIEVINQAGITTTISFTYDRSGRRLSKTVTNEFGSETTLYPFADYEITSEGKTKVSISANNMHLATVETSPSTIDNGLSTTRILFSHTDHLGGGNILTDSSGDQVQTLDYFPFGSIRVDEQYQNFDETKKFTGHEFDDESGLYYAQARYYDSEIGRFISVDPWNGNPNDPQSFNKYAYVRNNPLILIDPTGKSWETLEKIDNAIKFTGDALTFGTYSKTLDTLETLGDKFAEEPSFRNGVDTFGTAIGGAFIITGTTLVNARIGVAKISTEPIKWGAKKLATKGLIKGGIETYKYINPKEPEPIETYNVLNMDTGLTDYTIKIYEDKIQVGEETYFTFPIESSAQKKQEASIKPKSNDDYWKKRQTSINEQGLPSNIQGPAKPDGSF